MASCAGRDAHATPLMGAEHALEGISHRHAPSHFVLGALKESRAAKQLGTLGGGNHFLEVASPPLQPRHCLACILLLKILFLYQVGFLTGPVCVWAVCI